MVPRRPDAAFVFQVYDLEKGLAIDHQYDRSVGVPRPHRPVILRAQTAQEYDELTVIGATSPRAMSPADLNQTGVRYPGRRVAGHWEVVLPGMDDDTNFHYLVAARRGDGQWRYADGAHGLDDAKVFTHRVTSRLPPAWTHQAVVYQIFVDRFASADGPVAPTPTDDAWAGGDLHGIRKALPYVADLGINAVWLTPVFACHSYHGYDTVDYRRVDERFGGEAALEALVATAGESGIRIILDLVPNHVSNHHPWFQDALAGGPKRDWFTFEPDGSYVGFFGSKEMPKVDLTHPDAVDAIVDAATYWVEEFGIDGYRIDYVLGPEESFFATLSAEMQARNSDVWLFGEATATAAFSRRYGGILDGVTDFMLAYAWRDLLQGKLTAEGFVEVEQEAQAVLPHADFNWVRFFDNHDMSRALHVWDDDTARLMRATEMLLALPGVPVLFYGTEQALTHELGQEVAGLAVSRVPMRFDDPALLVAPMQRHIRARTAAAGLGNLPIQWSIDGATARWDWGDFTGTVPG